MKKRKNTKGINLALEKVSGIARHIQNVQDNCLLLGTKLISEGEIELGRKVIQKGFKHDVSKFDGIEWDNMAPGVPVQEDTAKLKLKMAVHHHNSTNPHHPEYWKNGIHGMPEEYVGEMVCDWKSRSEEFGTDLREWIEERATKRWDFNKESPIYKMIFRFVDLLCDKPFAGV